jgi:hypothetical protein
MGLRKIRHCATIAAILRVSELPKNVTERVRRQMAMLPLAPQDLEESIG